MLVVDTKGLPVETTSEKETRSVVAALRGGEESKAEGVSKGGWETMERDGKPGSIRRAGVARQTLFPKENKQAVSPPKWYWWRSRFSRLESDEFELKVSVIFDFATSKSCAAGAPPRMKKGRMRAGRVPRQRSV